MSSSVLTPIQQAHVDSAFPECCAEMARHLLAGAVVHIGRQHEVGEAPPYAITAVGTDFWIDCCPSAAAAQQLARDLGLRVEAGGAG
ncbi:MAG: hypothetical protein JOY60_17335 [Burkholderiaceae bacterium]|nr:hypothetical protein [Burkholderiaceae bacterium]